MANLPDFRLGIVDGAELDVSIDFDNNPVTRVNPPSRCVPRLYSVTFGRGDGSTAGHGFPLTTWFWKVMRQSEVDQIADLIRVGGVLPASRAVWIRTRKPDSHGDFDFYTAWLRWPQDLHDRRQSNGLYFDVAWEFTMLEAYAGPA